MKKSLPRSIAAIVTAVGTILTPTAGLALADQPGDTDATTTIPLPPPVESTAPTEVEIPPAIQAPVEVPPPDSGPPSQVKVPQPPAEVVMPEVPEAPLPEEHQVPVAPKPAPPVEEEPLPSETPSTLVEEPEEVLEVDSPVEQESEGAPVAPSKSVPSTSEEGSSAVTPSESEATEGAPTSELPTGELPAEEPSAVETPATEPSKEGLSTSERPIDEGLVGTETTPSGLPAESADDNTPSGQPTSPEGEEGASSTEIGEEPEAIPVASVPEPPQVDPAELQNVFAKEPILQDVKPVPTIETDQIYEQISKLSSVRDHDGRHEGRRDRHEWDGNVRPWSPHWIKYDHPRHRGPVFCNPYHDRDIKIVYVYQGHQYVRVIPPRQTIFVDVDVNVHNVYSFTAVHVKAGGVVVDVNVGTFHPWGYTPPVHTNVYVKTVVNNHYYPRPFRVKKVVDCGYDSVRRKTRVVFDDTYVAWGHWRGQGKDRHFALEESAKFPGMYGKAAEIIAAPPEPYVYAAQPKPVAAEEGLSAGEGYAITGGFAAFAVMVVGLAWALTRRKGAPPTAP